jgi:TolA-binding protein
MCGAAAAQTGPGRGPGKGDPEMEVTQKHNLQVARWYLTKRKAYEGARDRLQEILDQSPEFSQIDEVIFLLGEANERLRKPEIASTYYKKLIKDYPGSQFVKKARERLADLKLPPDTEDDKSKDAAPDKKQDKQPDSTGSH